MMQANIINRFGGVKMENIRGVRVPYLKPGWNRQFLMMKEFGFVYDSSIPTPLSDPPIWPYTLDYKIPHKCIGRRKCPSRSFPGIWVGTCNQWNCWWDIVYIRILGTALESIGV
jgi:hypothetical protein